MPVRMFVTALDNITLLLSFEFNIAHFWTYMIRNKTKEDFSTIISCKCSSLHIIFIIEFSVINNHNFCNERFTICTKNFLLTNLHIFVLFSSIT